MRAVNLLPRDGGAEGRRLPPAPVLVACGGAVVVTAILALLFLSASSKVGTQRQALENAQAQYEALPAPTPESPVVGQLPQLHQTRVGAMSVALGQRLPWDRLLREVSQVVPSDVWLLSLTANGPTVTAPLASATPGALPQEFVVTGCTYSQESVARFLARLDLVPDLQNVTLGKSAAGDSSATAGGGGACPKGMVDFQLNADMRTTGVPSS